MISSTLLRRLACGFAAVTVVTLIGGSTPGQRRRSTTHAAICGNPMISCPTIATFQPNDLPFRVPKNAVIVDTVPFYAIILQSMSVSNDNCDVFIPERDRLVAQALFPDHKVFGSRCTDPENLFYLDLSSRQTRNLSETHRIMAVYAGPTLAEAQKRCWRRSKRPESFPARTSDECELVSTAPSRSFHGEVNHGRRQTGN